MNTDKARLLHQDLTEQVIGAFYAVYNELGAGFLENVYENAMAIAISQCGLAVERQSPIRVHFRGAVVGEYRADLLIEKALVVEVKAAATLNQAHMAQLLNYLKATGKSVGLLLNFGPRPQFKRLIFG
ncbi:GxxExxY protein [Vulcaniibacterium gelatinicum]|uniref:GxxExxY protein n=1 Tax=Vulcaniibacterium gelatinicum TaxID=2598725 RepID=UPI0011CC6FB7|nr:GxxExxY protein [Vulcaniibacterium gelatinicum]